MNPQNNPTDQTNGLSLPPVDPGQMPPTQPTPVTPTPHAQAAQAPAPAPVGPAPATPAASTTPAPAGSEEALTGADGIPLIADDTDLIEKEWVEKAKQLVDQTKDDPYKQNKEINKFKATYIKKRYNKDIQLSKD